jgi:hypothetical protein
MMPMEPATVVISFCVRVLVLLVQMTDAFAMVSLNLSTHTKRSSFVICFIAKVNARVMARGGPVYRHDVSSRILVRAGELPSGMAITT